MNKSRTIQKALITVPYQGWHWDKLAEAFAPAEIARVPHGDTERVLKEIEDADVAVLGGNISDEMLAKAKKLKWVHCDMAGVNDSAKPEIFDRGIFLTASAGRSTQVLAEHTFFLMLSMTYASRELEENQRNHVWKNIYVDRRGLYTKTVGVVGLGHTGCEVARIGKAFGMNVLGYSRRVPEHPEYFDGLFTEDRGETMETLLRESDFVVLAVRLSDETYHMIGDKEFSLMKPTAFLINMARGAVVDEKALVKALQDHTIAGCGSDVFEQEPLPSDSPLWDMPNMVITPHATPEGPDLTANSLEIICENIRRYREGEKLLYVLGKNDMYTANSRHA